MGKRFALNERLAGPEDIGRVCDQIEEALPGLKYTEEEQQDIADQKHAAQMADLEPAPETHSSAPESNPVKVEP